MISAEADINGITSDEGAGSFLDGLPRSSYRSRVCIIASWSHIVYVPYLLVARYSQFYVYWIRERVTRKIQRAA
jgi:hypothetical protein